MLLALNAFRSQHTAYMQLFWVKIHFNLGFWGPECLRNFHYFPQVQKKENKTMKYDNYAISMRNFLIKILKDAKIPNLVLAYSCVHNYII